MRHDFIFVMNKDISIEQLEAVSNDLTERKFNCVIRKDDEEDWLLLIGLNDHNIVLKEAENQLCLAPRTHKDPVKKKRAQERKEKQRTYLDSRILECEERKPFDFDAKDEFCGGDYDEILTEAEKSRIIYIILHKLLLKQMTNTQKAFPSASYARMGEDEDFLKFLIRLDLLKEIVPLHSKAQAIRACREGSVESSLLKQIKSLSTLFIDVKQIRDYYGEETAIYFEWMNHWQKWLLVPSLFAIVVYVGNTFLFDITISPLAGLFSAFMAVWGTLYIVNWRRHTKELNTYWEDYAMKYDIDNIRKEFYGETRINQVTDEPELYFTTLQRLPLYFKSLCICLPCLGAAMAVIVAFLNATGVIRPTKEASMFDIPSLSKLADPGALFDPEGYMNMGAAIAQAVITVVMNVSFKHVAIYTAEQENHATQKDFNKSVFIKRFLFEFTDFQVYLFYIGIYQLDMKNLRVNLIALFMVDEFRRVACEVILPYLMQHQGKKVVDKILRKDSRIKETKLSIQDEIVEAEI